jgi:cubilin
MDCTYTIEVEHDLFIKLTYNYLDLEEMFNRKCYDFITISGIDGADGGSETNCEKPRNDELNSINNLVTINFQTDQDVSGTGFMITYESRSKDQLCGQTFFNSSHGVVKSPGWPDEYPPNMNCTYTIEAEDGQVIFLNYNHLKLEFCSDFITISFINGPSSKFCEMDQMLEQNSMTNLVTITFISKEDVSSSGFLITYGLHALYQDKHCGQTFFNDSHGEIKSPGWPYRYLPNMNCTYTIEVEPGQVIWLFYNHLDLKREFVCIEMRCELTCNDFITLSFINASSSRFCKKTPSLEQNSMTNRVTITFHSNQHLSDSGFLITYGVVAFSQDPVCGQTYFNGSHGLIMSPGWQYPLSCTYTIEAQQDQVIWLNYNYLELPYSISCQSSDCKYTCFDYYYITLSFINESSSKFCYKDQNMEQNSMTNLVTITFHSDWRASDHGFLITYGHEAFPQDTACGQTFFNSSEGVITSPGWSIKYPPNLRCTYTIEAEENQVIKLTYNHLDLDRISESMECDDCPSSTCFDYITMSFTNGSYNRYCSTSQSIEQNSMNNLVTIHFNSQHVRVPFGPTAGLGFNITYEALSPDQV